MNMKKYFQTFILAIFSGLCIGIGGTVYLLQENSIIGSLLFSLGLITILVFGFNLFTGKVGYIVVNKPIYIIEVAVVWVGNFLGTYIFSILIRNTRVYPKISEKCAKMVDGKLADSYISLFILGIFCGLLMFIAVDTFKKYYKEIDFLCCLLCMLCVSVFILSGYEHCIADMYYFALADKIGASIVPLIIITLGNALGGNLIPMGQILHRKLGTEE